MITWSTILRRRAWIIAGSVTICMLGAGAAFFAMSFSTAEPASASAQANPVLPVMIQAMTAGTSMRLTPLSNTAKSAVTPHIKTAAQVEQTAQTEIVRPGSPILGTSLAYASGPLLGSRRLVWLVSVDPAGGLHSVSPPERLANYCVQVIDASTGKWIQTLAGLSPSLPALPPVPTGS
jgi:hypothetical protein